VALTLRLGSDYGYTRPDTIHIKPGQLVIRIVWIS